MLSSFSKAYVFLCTFKYMSSFLQTIATVVLGLSAYTSTVVFLYLYKSLGLSMIEMKGGNILYGEWEAIYNQSVDEGIVNSWAVKISA